MASNPKRRYSIKEYFEIEKNSEAKHEFVYGEVFAMVGASERHNAIASNINAEIQQHFKRNSILTCKTYSADMRTRINDQLYYYPDIVVGCNIRLEIMDNQETLINPILVVEILSRSTAKFDMDAKFQEYQQIESLRYYLLVSQNQINATLFTRQDDNSWNSTSYNLLSSIIELPLVRDCRLALSDIYWNVGL